MKAIDDLPEKRRNDIHRRAWWLHVWYKVYWALIYMGAAALGVVAGLGFVVAVGSLI